MQPDQIARKIRENLIQQKNKLENYLDLLEAEENDIVDKDPDQLLVHINLEKEIIEELSLFKKILLPLEEYYFNLPYKKDPNIFNLKTCLDDLSQSVKEKSKNNKIMLETLIENVKLNLKNMKRAGFTPAPYRAEQSSIVDISG